MTLILTATGRDSIWLLADRRLSVNGLPKTDEARKVMFLETPDAVAILGYAGLGATAIGNEPADWMTAVLRGRNYPLERSIATLAEAIKAQLPRHMQRIPHGNSPLGHHVLVTAFFGVEPRLYLIELMLLNKQVTVRHVRLVSNKPPGSLRTPRIGIAGSGASYLLSNRSKLWVRALLRTIKAHETGSLSAHAVADHLAGINNQVHLSDKFVGPRCIVAWRHRKGGRRFNGGGGHAFYTGTTRDGDTPLLPSIMNGADMHAIMSIFAPTAFAHINAMMDGTSSGEPDMDEVNRQIARLPRDPDETLR